MRIALVFSLLISILAVIFALQNPEMMDVNIGTAVFTGSTALILIITFFIGVLVGVLGTLPSAYRSKRQVNRLRKRISEEPAHTTTATPMREEHHHHHSAAPAETTHQTDDHETAVRDETVEPHEETRRRKKSKWL